MFSVKSADRSRSTAASIDFGQLIDERPISLFQYRLFAFCIAVGVLDGMDTQSIGVAAGPMASELSFPLSDLGTVFSSALLGATIGAITFGALADRFGRKRMMIAAVAVFGVFTLATAMVPSFGSLIAVRFLAGLGLGGATPCFLALGAEYAPRRRRPSITSLLWAGFPLGATLGGFLNSFILKHFDWHALFYVGGALPLALATLLLLYVPESVRFLLSRKPNSPEIAAIARQLDPRLVLTDSTRFFLQDEPTSKHASRQILVVGRVGATLMLWSVFFMAFGTLTIVALWTPALLHQGGMSASNTALAVGCNGLGGLIGVALAGRLIERFGIVAALCPSLLIGAMSIGMLGKIGVGLLEVCSAMAMAGFWVSVGGAGVVAVASSIYPTTVRSTGVGRAMGAGRLGQFIGPLFITLLLHAHWTIASMFAVVALAPATAAMLVFLLDRPSRTASSG